MGVIGGLVALVIVLAVAAAAGFALRRRQGRFRPAKKARRPQSAALVRGSDAGDDALSAADLGAPLGARATLVQFSAEVCSFCGPTRELLSEIARETDGVVFVEIDAAARMDLTRRLRVLSTPTVLVLDALGGITSRASGPLRKADVLTALKARDAA